LDGLLSIQEFSNLSGVEASTLRYWDEIGLFSPTTRNPDNNYRYYSLPQILTLNFVTTLSDLQVPLKTIAELRQERDPENLLLYLEKLEHSMDMEMRNLRLRYSIIHARQELIRFGMRIEESQISVAEKEEKAIIVWPENEYEEGDTFIKPLSTFVNQTRNITSISVSPLADTITAWNPLPMLRRAPTVSTPSTPRACKYEKAEITSSGLPGATTAK